MSAPHHPQLEPLVERLSPLLETVAELPLDDCRDHEAASRIAAQLERTHPANSSPVQAIGQALRAGIHEGWLCDRGQPHARFGRIAKPTAKTRDLSIDLVSLEGAGLRHRHPRGEVTLAFAADPERDDGRFDGHRSGWIVMPAGSVHTPTVTGPRMLTLYFLPGGAAEWNPSD